MSTRTSGDYQTGGQDAVLRVTVGEGQKGRVRIRHNGEVVAEGSGKVQAELVPGRGEVRVVATVNHTNKKTNAASVTYEFSGGAVPDSFQGEGDFSQGEPIDFIGEFTLS
jgi:hypothetical protein